MKINQNPDQFLYYPFIEIDRKSAKIERKSAKIERKYLKIAQK